MRRALHKIGLLSILLLLGFTIGALPVAAQQTPPPAPTAGTAAPTPDLELRLSRLEIQQTESIDALRTSSASIQNLFNLLVGIITLLVLVQSFFTWRQTRQSEDQEAYRRRREDEQSGQEKQSTGQMLELMQTFQQLMQNRVTEEVRQAGRSAQRDDLDRVGITQVTEVMGVVQRTLESRLDAEKEARGEAKQAREELEGVKGKIQLLEVFLVNFQHTITNARNALEDAARELVLTSRHDFRSKAARLSAFAQQFDTFNSQYAALEAQPADAQRPLFSARVLYIRGIAAHYGNQPVGTKEYLEQVVRLPQPERDEEDLAFKRRKGNAYYYLGVNEANFGHNQEAIDYFESAAQNDVKGTDFLTRLVMAEAYIMNDDFASATSYVNEVLADLDAMEQRETKLRTFHQRLKSRAALIQANIVIQQRSPGWAEAAQRLLESVHTTDRQYYYVTATLAQIYHHLGQQPAGTLFRETFEAIDRSGDLLLVTEARSVILLLMVAGMCCKHGLADERRSDEFLDRADRLRENLPQMGSQTCTAFSTLSKRNESKEGILLHIGLIREGKVLLAT